MDDALLRADCARCAALCCVTLAFDRSDLFAFAKAAGEPCPHLTAKDRCGIHAERARRGFAGCAAYDCLGAGQRVTQEIFGGRSWQAHPAEAQPMFEAFRVMRRVHELLSLLRTASRLPLSPEKAERLRALEEKLNPADGWSQRTLARLDAGRVSVEVHAFLRSLRPLVRGRRLPLVE
jgi:hypothetical protein